MKYELCVFMSIWGIYEWHSNIFSINQSIFFCVIYLLSIRASGCQRDRFCEYIGPCHRAHFHMVHLSEFPHRFQLLYFHRDFFSVRHKISAKLIPHLIWYNLESITKAICLPLSCKAGQSDTLPLWVGVEFGTLLSTCLVLEIQWFELKSIYNGPYY